MSRKCEPGCTCKRHQNKGGFVKGVDGRTGRPTRDPLERFMEKVEPLAPPDGIEGDCLMWTAGTRGGNAQFWDGERMAYGHIWIYKRLKGLVPKGHDLHHRCARHLCMNVEHIEPLTKQDHGRTPEVAATWFPRRRT